MRSSITAFVAVLIGLLMLDGTARADDTPRDGNWWIEYPQKLSYVIGFFDGTTFQTDRWVEGLSVNLLSGPPVPKECNESCRKAIVNWAVALKDYVNNTNNLRGVTAGEVVEGMDRIYADSRNRGIHVADAMDVVVESIKGSSKDGIEKRLEYFRQAASKN